MMNVENKRELILRTIVEFEDENDNVFWLIDLLNLYTVI